MSIDVNSSPRTSRMEDFANDVVAAITGSLVLTAVLIAGMMIIKMETGSWFRGEVLDSNYWSQVEVQLY